MIGVSFIKRVITPHFWWWWWFCLQIDAHVGGVNDLAFSHPNKQLCVITCGDDKTIKVGFNILQSFFHFLFIFLYTLCYVASCYSMRLE